VLYPGVDAARFTPEGPDFRRLLALESRPVIGTLSRLVERKGFDTVLRAMPRVLEEFPDALYLVVGDGPDRPRLEALTRKLGIGDSVHFAGAADEESLAAWFRTLDVFVMPSREIASSGHVEGFGIVFLEAGACGRPVLGGRSGGVVEAVQDGVSGRLVNPGDPEDLAQALLGMLRDPHQARAMGRAGRLRVEREFAWEKVLEPLGDFLETLCAREAR